MVAGRGQFLYDERGNEYLDCINNVAHVGHGNAHVAESVARQMRLLNTNSRFLHDNLSLYARRLTNLFPAHLSVCYLVNSGSEANDLAMRLARAYTGRKDIVCLDGAYHGNLTSTMAISPYKTVKLHGYKQPKWVHVAPSPCEYRGQYNRDTSEDKHAGPEAIGRQYAEATEQLIEAAKSRGRQVAAQFVESMVSCGGQFPLPRGYLRHLQRYLHSNGSLLVCDEVQTGFGRSGKRMWAFQLDGDDIRPDIVTMGKPMGNGFPVSAVVTTREVAASFQAIGTEYFNTFGGNPASCAAAIAVLDEIDSRKLMREADRIGSFMLDELRKLQQKSQVIGDVRGCGFFIGLDIVEDRESKRVAPDFARFLVQRFRDDRILMSTEGKFGNVLKFKPPMVFNMDDARRFLRVLAAGVEELEAQVARSSPDQLAAALAALSTGTPTNTAPARSSASSGRSSTSSASSISSSSWLGSSCEM